MASFDKFLTKVFGSSNQRYLKTVQPVIAKINDLEPSIKALSDAQLRARTTELKERVANAVKDARDPEERRRLEQEVLDEVLPDALATIRRTEEHTSELQSRQ